MSEGKSPTSDAKRSPLENADVGAIPRKSKNDPLTGQGETERMPSAEGGGQRAYSPSSVSSAASTRPLEWDSGADVGYLLQNEERQLANAMKKLGFGFSGAGGSKSEGDAKETAFNNQKITVDSLREDSTSTPLSESTPKVEDGLKKAGSSSLGGSRQTLPKTASSSSVATVVSKEAEITRSTDLINDLTKSLQLVKSLIAETKGDKEKQSRLLAHVVQQLKTVEDSKHRNRHHRRTKHQVPNSNSSSNAADSSSNSSNVVEKLKRSYLTQKQSASGDSSVASTALESSAHSQVEEAYQKLLSDMPNQDNERLVAWANSQERLAEYPPDPKLTEALDFNDAKFAKFLEDYINTECQRQACWRSDVLNLMSQRAELVKQKQGLPFSKETTINSTSQSTCSSDKVEINPSNIFPFTVNPSSKTSKKKKNQDIEPKAKIFQHVINPTAEDIARAKWQRTPPKQGPSRSGASRKEPSKFVLPKEKPLNEKVPPNLDAFLTEPSKLTLFKPAVVELAKKKLKTPTKSSKEPSPQKADYQLPLQECLKKRRPHFIARADNRRKCLALLGERRQERANMRRQCLKDQVDRYSGSLPDHIIIDPLPPPPLTEYRLFTQQQLREQTERKYKKLAEIKKKEELKEREEEHKTNRLMAQIFKRKLQNRVLHHKVDMSNSMSVITSED